MRRQKSALFYSVDEVDDNLTIMLLLIKVRLLLSPKFEGPPGFLQLGGQQAGGVTVGRPTTPSSLDDSPET